MSAAALDGHPDASQVSGVTKEKLDVIYDGDCPFCSRYVHLARLRESFDVRLVNAREEPGLAGRYRGMGYDLADGMVVRRGDQIYYGHQAIHVISLLSSRSGLWNRLLALSFRNEAVARVAYPVLRAGRNLTLMLLGRRRSFEDQARG